MSLSITLIIIIVTVGVSLYSFERREMMDKLIFNPYVVNIRKEWYRFFSHGLIHADYVHLAVNMWVLYIFGRTVEAYYSLTFGTLGALGYVLMYAAAIGIASIRSYFKHKVEPGYNALGASGATSAVVFASIVFEPFRGIGLLFIPFYIPGILFGVLYLIYSSYMSKRGSDNIGHDAHFDGAIFGFVYTIMLKPQLGLDLIQKIGAYLGIG